MALSELARTAGRRTREKLESMCPGRLREVRIFGSMARGEAHAESDLDLLILVDGEDPQLLEMAVRATTAVEAELRFPFPISPCVMSVQRFEEMLERELLFATDVEADGVTV